jgi:hypothetical protein
MEKHRGYLVGHLMSLLLCMLPLPFLCGFYPVVHFTEEQIDIRVYPDQVIVDGYYVYQNPFPFPVSQGFTIPFPVDDRHSAPSSLQVRQLEPEEKDIGPWYMLGVHRFSLPFKANGACSVHVRYRQKVMGKSASYILVTTKPWRRPLQRAVYRMFPEGVEISASNYRLSRQEQGFLEFRRENFMPDEDWRFSWNIKS